jgi:hypothetical protein
LSVAFLAALLYAGKAERAGPVPTAVTDHPVAAASAAPLASQPLPPVHAAGSSATVAPQAASVTPAAEPRPGLQALSQASPVPVFVTSGEGAQLDDELYLGRPVRVENVTAWPVYSRKPAPRMDQYLTLAEAQERKLAEVRETGAAPSQPPSASAPQSQPADVGGQVSKVVIENKGTLPILVLAGTLVKGGKQDRQIAQDFIIAAGQTVPVDA